MHTLAVKQDGSVFSWGKGKFGVLGLEEDEANALSPQFVASPLTVPKHVLPVSWRRKTIASPSLMRRNLTPPKRSSFLHKREEQEQTGCSMFVDAAAGRYHSLVLMNGGLYSCGEDRCGVLGLSS